MSARASILSSRDSYDPSTRLGTSVRRSNSRGRQDHSHHSHHSQHLGAGADLGTLSGNPGATSPLAQSFEMHRSDSRGGGGPLQDEISVGSRGGRGGSGSDDVPLQRSLSAASRTSRASAVSGASNLSRGNTLRKQKSLSRKSSLKRSGSRRSVNAGSIGGVTYDDTTGVDTRSVFYTPVPTTGTPTDILAARFQGWRKVLKDLIVYFREVQTSYEARAKAITKVQHGIDGISMPLGFLQEGGLGEANIIFQQHYKQVIQETIKAKEIEHEVISQLASLRNDLNQKIKEIKSLAGDFKNSIEKEKGSTKKAINALQDALANVDLETKAMVGKDDPYIVRLGVERQVERQIDEENYLHRAYLNIEGSGRELESIVVGEIQKAYKAFATILRKEADDAYDTADQLTTGPINMEKDFEWSQFVATDPHFSCQDIPLRRAQDLEFPGKFHPAAAEVRAGMLERKSKYLKSYTPGWYVLSPTHLHEFRSADSVYSQAPVMSLYLLDQKLGAHSQPDSKSHKFILKGRQTGAMHRGHSWVFRAETYDTMLAWYDDIKSLTEKTGAERNDFVRRHTRSHSAQSSKSAKSASSWDEDDEADNIPYSGAMATVANGSANAATTTGAAATAKAPQQERPQGGRFPSDILMGPHGVTPRLTPSSDGSDRGHPVDASASSENGDGGVDDEGSGTGGLASIGRSSDGKHQHQHQKQTQGPSHAARKVAAYETPLPVQHAVPEPHEAEYLMTTPFQLEPVEIPVGSTNNNTAGKAIPDSMATADNIGYFGSGEQRAWRQAEPKTLTDDPSSNIIAPGHEISASGAAAGAEKHTDQPMGSNSNKSSEFGSLARKNTDQSVSHLHVPGEYPRAGLHT